jgi:flavodoxin I
MSIAIIYGSNGGVTESVAKMIQDKLGLESELHNIYDMDMEVFEKSDKCIIGTSTWGEGDLQDDWDDRFSEYKGVEFGGKTVAFFGTGDQEGYADNFLDAMGSLYEVALENGATIVGNNWSTQGYEFDESTAIVDDAFVGLAIDEDNQDELTEERVAKWVEIIKPSFE